MAAVCRVVRPPATDICGETADHLVTFHDEQKVHACQACALYLGQLAGTHGTMIRAEKLEKK